MHDSSSVSARLMPIATLLLAGLGLLVTYVSTVAHAEEREGGKKITIEAAAEPGVRPWRLLIDVLARVCDRARMNSSTDTYYIHTFLIISNP